MNRRTDWITWSLLFFTGLAAGGMTGLMTIHRGRQRFGEYRHHPELIAILYRLHPDFIALFLWGAALIGGGLFSRFLNERLWTVSPLRNLPPGNFQPTAVSRAVSNFATAAGVVFAVTALAGHFGIFKE